jgi:glutamate-1-semialdehyde 2,1-aminomutase
MPSADDLRSGGPANTEALDDAVRRVEASYIARNPRSQAAFERARGVLPGGNTRSVLYYDPFPLSFARGEGARLWDADGHAYVDNLGEYTAGLFGHSHPVISAAIRTALEDGLSLGGLNRYEAEYAELIRQRFPSCDRLRFCNSGTEANLMAITAARLATGRAEVLVFDGAYHGGVLSFPGRNQPWNAPFPYRYGRYNDVEATAAALAGDPDAVAAVLVEPMMGSAGAIPAEPGFLAYLREVTARHGIVLILDEVMTSRNGPGGLQGRLGLSPDLTTFGKYLGGGLSFGAFGGRADLMDVFDTTRPSGVSHAGTFNNNTLSLAGGLAGLKEVFTPEMADRHYARGERFRAQLAAAGAAHGVPLQVTGSGSIMAVHIQATAPIRRPADVVAPPAARKLLHLALLERGYSIARRGLISLSLPLTDADDSGFLEAFDDVLATYAAPLVEAAGG